MNHYTVKTAYHYFGSPPPKAKRSAKTHENLPPLQMIPLPEKIWLSRQSNKGKTEERTQDAETVHIKFNNCLTEEIFCFLLGLRFQRFYHNTNVSWQNALNLILARKFFIPEMYSWWDKVSFHTKIKFKLCIKFE